MIINNNNKIIAYTYLKKQNKFMTIFKSATLLWNSNNLTQVTLDFLRFNNVLGNTMGYNQNLL